MTEQPDTAAMREGSAAFPDDLLWHRTQTLTLCDALDAARAERDKHKPGADQWHGCCEDIEVIQQRTEAAEARCAQLEDRNGILLRAEWAEARIAAALDLCATTPTSPCDPYCRVIDIRRALTEERND